MKTINNKIEKEDNSKIKKAFKKLKNAFVVGTAALMITCGGVESDGNSSNLKNIYPSEVLQYAKDKNLNDYFDATEGPDVFNADIEPVIIELSELCKSRYNVIVPNDVFKSSDKEVNVYNMSEKSQIEEFLFKSNDMKAIFPDLVEGIIYGDYNKFDFKMVSSSTIPPGLVFIAMKYMDKYSYKHYNASNISGFAYTYIATGEYNLDAPYLFLCHSIYNRSAENLETEAFGRMLIIPNSKFWKLVDNSGVSRETVSDLFKN
jgi:hypothetical protein